jgi:hypothetical protein
VYFCLKLCISFELLFDVLLAKMRVNYRLNHSITRKTIRQKSLNFLKESKDDGNIKSFQKIQELYFFYFFDMSTQNRGCEIRTFMRCGPQSIELPLGNFKNLIDTANGLTYSSKAIILNCLIKKIRSMLPLIAALVFTYTIIYHVTLYPLVYVMLI